MAAGSIRGRWRMRSQAVRGIKLVRSARIVVASGASDDWREGMKASARSVLEVWNADLAIVGLVKKSGEVLSLWFVPRSGDGTLGRGDQPYKLEDVTLGPDFHDDLRAQLTAAALTTVAPLAGSGSARPRVGARAGRGHGENYATSQWWDDWSGGTPWRPACSTRQWPCGVLGKRESGSERLEQAVEAYRAALEVHTRERAPIDWASTQNNIGVALQALGEREGGTERLERAVEAYSAALEVRARERHPLDWASTQNNLGNALWTLGKRGKWYEGSRASGGSL